MLLRVRWNVGVCERGAEHRVGLDNTYKTYNNIIYNTYNNNNNIMYKTYTRESTASALSINYKPLCLATMFALCLATCSPTRL